MKHPKLTSEQELVNEVIAIVADMIGVCNLQKWDEMMSYIRKKYHMPKHYLTLKEYILSHEAGSYHTFHFYINGTELCMNNLGGFLNEEYCHLYKYVNKFYVIDDNQRDNGGDFTNYHCDHYLALDIKED